MLGVECDWMRKSVLKVNKYRLTNWAELLILNFD